MSIVLIVIAVLIIWFIWGLNNKNKTADKIVARGGMREVYATLIEACSPAGEVRVIKEKADMISLRIESRYSVMYLTIAQNMDQVSIAVVVGNSMMGKVRKLFSFPETMDQHQMVRIINETVSEMIDKKKND